MSFKDDDPTVKEVNALYRNITKDEKQSPNYAQVMSYAFKTGNQQLVETFLHQGEAFEKTTDAEREVKSLLAAYFELKNQNQNQNKNQGPQWVNKVTQSSPSQNLTKEPLK